MLSLDIGAAVSKVYDIVGPSLFRQCGYIVCYNSHASELRREIRDLRNAVDRLQHKVDHAVSVGEVVEQDVWTWLTDAEELIKSKNLILEKDVVSCCFGFVPNPKARYVLGRGAKKSLPELRALIERGKFDEVSYHPAAELATEVKVRSAASSSSTVRYVDLKSRALVLKRIMADLNDHDRIGVYGMGGVGKTTLLRDVEKRARESGKFDDVVTVYVSQAPDIEGIKSKIRNKLGSLGSNEANKKTLLVLLDDLWSKLKDVENLKKDNVKVKWVMTSRKQELLSNGMGCYPTISLGVLEEEEVWSFFGKLVNNNKDEDMKNNPAVAALLKKCAGLPVSIEALANVLEKKGLSSIDLVNADVLKLGKETISGSASLELSYKYLGDSDVANLAKSLFRIIGLLGTPTVPILTLVKYTIGLGLLGGGGSSSDGNIMERARRQVSSSLRMLQDASLLLESDESDYVKIHDVVRDVAASIASRDDRALIFDSEDGLTGCSQDDIPTLNEEAGAGQGSGLVGTNSSNNNITERDTSHVISLRMLQDASLLIGSDNSIYVKIHGVVRDIATSITSEDDHALIVDRDDGMRGRSKEKLKKSRSVYLPYSVIPKLSEGLECPELIIFIMDAAAAQGDQDLSSQKEGRCHVELPSSFQKGMVKLKVLDLRNAWLTSLPSSIQPDLCNLTTLFLHFCCIENVSVIGNLKSLQILSFVGSDLAHLPKEIGDLAKLRMLDLSHCSKLKTIVPGTLERLTRLEELYIKESFDGWEVEGAEQPTNSSLAELNHLHRLRTLEVRVPDTKTLPPSLPLGNLARYKVLIGDSWDWSGEYRESRTLKFKDSSKNILTQDWIQCALQTTQDLSLDCLCGPAGGSFHEQCKERFKELKHLHLQNSSSIQYVIWSTEWLACSAFTTLESMILENMDSLEKLCHGLINSTSFSKLKVLKVQECHKLRNLFNLSLVNSLTELEEIEVSDCKEVREIVTADEEMEDDEGTEKEGMKRCPNNLFGCPSKRSKGMARAPYVIKLGNLRCLILRNMPKLITFFGNEVLSESMETTDDVLLNEAPSENVQENEEMDNEGTEDDDHKEGMKRCPANNLFGCFIKRSFFGNEALNESTETIDHHVLLNDQKGTLQRCKPKKLWSTLKYQEIPPTTHLELDKLQRLELVDCDGIAHFLSSSMLLKFVNLESLTIESCGSLEDIFDLNRIDAKSRNIDILPRLSELKLKGLPKLVHIWKKNDMQIKGCRSLRTVEIYGCNSLLYLFSSSMCEGMVNLTEISVGHCDKMEAVFLEKGTTSNASSVTTGLTSLKTLVITHCPNLKAFLSGESIGLIGVESSTTSNGNKKGMPYWCCGKQADDLADTSSFFNQKVFLPELESLIISGGGEFKKLWCSDEVPAKSYCKLEFIHIEYCQNLLTVLPATLVERLQKLRHLLVNNCEKLETVINLVVDWETSKKKPKSLMLPQLQKLKLESLVRLRCIIETNSDDEIVVGFPNLKRVVVLYCKELTHLIPAATATTLLKLDELEIRSCGELKEVVYGKVSERNKRNDVIAFPHLTSLTFSWVDKLTCFYSQDGEDRSNTAATQAFFNDKVHLPNLEKCHISHSHVVEELWGDEPPMGSFCKLKELTVWYCEGLRNMIPLFLVDRLQGLESMEIGRCESLEEDIFNITSTEPILSADDSRDAVVEEGRHVVKEIKEGRHATETRIIVITLTKLTTLKLGYSVKLGNLLSGRYILKLPSLKKLKLDETTAKTTAAILEKAHLPNVEELTIFQNEEMAELWQSEPPIGSFYKLKTLEVRWCSKLIKVIPLFMLKRLQNLEKLIVDDCESLETISELLGGLDKHVGETTADDSELPCSYHNFRNLTSVSVKECKSLKNLFSFSRRRHDHEYGKETSQPDDSTNDDRIVLPQLNELRLEDLPNFSQLFHVVHGQYTLELPALKEFLLIMSGDKEAVTQKVAFPKEVEIQVRDVSNFFGTTRSVVSDIVKALQQKNQVIIGLLGFMGDDMAQELKEEATNLFDKVVLFSIWNETTAEAIQAGLGEELSIVYRGERELEGEELSIVYGGEREVEGRAERLRKTLLTYIRHKRLLLIFPYISEDCDIKMLEAAGIPRDGLDPKQFNIILVSEINKEILLEMGAKQPFIPIGQYIDSEKWWEIFQQELDDDSQKALFVQQQQQEAEEEEEEHPAFFDTTTDHHHIISSFLEPNTLSLNNTIKALRSHQHRNLIIGVLGPKNDDYMDWFMDETIGSLSKEENLFDEATAPDDNEVDTIQEELETALGIITSSSSETAADEKAQRIRQTLLSSNTTTQQKKRLLLVLNNLDQEVDLEAVGIPLHDGGLDPKFFKILLHSDNIQVLHKMGAQQVFEFESIKSYSYYDEFSRILDGYVHESDLKKLADECGSEDLVKLLARKLKTQGLEAWANAYRRLKESPFEYEERKKVIDSIQGITSSQQHTPSTSSS